MKKANLYHVLGIVFLLMMSGITYADTSRDHFGFIQSIDDSQNNAQDLKVLRVSGKKYFFDWNSVKVIYKDVYINVAGLAKGMQIKFHTIGTTPERITKITILSEHDMLINH